MPRVSTQPISPNSSGGTSGAVNNAAGSLRRNQACHQCRKRKLKCDAQMPCSACVRSHKYSLKSHPGSTGPTPDCTFDDPSEIAEGSKGKLSKLESRIGELEKMLREKEASSTTASEFPPLDIVYASTAPGGAATTFPLGLDSGLITDSVMDLEDAFPWQRPEDIAINTGTSPAAVTPSLLFSNTNTLPFNPPVMLPTPLNSPPNIFTAMIDPSWPPNMPQMDLLIHLVDTFFSCVPHANRVLHRPTFMSSLLNHPSSYDFPHPAILHAICAISSLYTPIITHQKLEVKNSGTTSAFNSGIIDKSSYHERQPNSAPGERQNRKAALDEEEIGFGMAHARWCSQAFYTSIQTGDRLYQLLQATLILTWYYYSTGRSVDVWVYVGSACRLILPLGLNTSAGWTPLSRLPPQALSMLTRPKNSTEAELGRNIFWLTYLAERLYTAGSVWPLTFQDEDISQIMPVRLEDFVHANEIPTNGRQRLASHKMIISHPPSTTDSFTLYIKGAVLMGKVKMFNARFRSKYDEEGQSSSLTEPGASMDPRDTAEFQVLDTLITSFKSSFPRDFKDPIGSEGKVDPILYTAHLLPHAAMIVLHDPHAEISSTSCLSSERLLAASRAVLDLIYKICATSFDLLLLDHACSFIWFLCGTTLLRFMKASITTGDIVSASRLNSEIDVVRFMLSNMGERTAIGLRQVKLLDEMYAQDIGTFIPMQNASMSAAGISEVLDILSV